MTAVGMALALWLALCVLALRCNGRGNTFRAEWYDWRGEAGR